MQRLHPLERDLAQAESCGDEPRSYEGVEIPAPWQALLAPLLPLRPVQAQALPLVLRGRQNLVVSAPTASGKSLVGHLALLDALSQGRRALLLEPLRALARAQVAALEDLVPRSPTPEARVRLSTGDQPLRGELLRTAAPPEGEVVVATPERLDGILLNPEHDPWVHSLGAVVVDEAQLLADPHRGLVLEHALAALLSLPSPPRLVLLSATLGQAGGLCEWLRPCTLVRSTHRIPPLHLEVLTLEADEAADAVVSEEVERALGEPGTSALVFVYRRDSAERLARDLDARLGPLAGAEGVVCCHAGLPRAEQVGAAEALSCRRSRCVVSTTALSMGLNLPATHVWVRDTTFHGHGRARVGTLLQMLGRAGRGARAGHGAVLLRPGDAWEAATLLGRLSREEVEPVRSALAHEPAPERVAELLGRLLARGPEEGLDLEALSRSAHLTLAGPELTPHLEAGLAWLQSPARALAWRDREHWRLTALGRLAVESSLDLAAAAGVGQLLRDLLSLPEGARLLHGWQPVDSVLVVELLSVRSEPARAMADPSTSLRSSTSALAPWLLDTPEALLGSLGLTLRGDPTRLARAAGARALRPALAPRDREHRAWRLAGLAHLCQGRALFFHLRSRCGKDPAGIREADSALAQVRRSTWEAVRALGDHP